MAKQKLNPQDSTRRNARASRNRDEALAARIKALEARVRKLESQQKGQP